MSTFAVVAFSFFCTCTCLYLLVWFFESAEGKGWYLVSSRLRRLMKDDPQQKLRSQGQQICCLSFRPTSKKSLGFLSFHIMVAIPWYDVLLSWMDHPPRRNRKKDYESLTNQSTAIISNSFFGCFSDTCRARFLRSLLALHWFVWLGGGGGLSRCSCNKRIGRSWGRKIARGDGYEDAWRYS